jgi:hypothetical protein
MADKICPLLNGQACLKTKCQWYIKRNDCSVAIIAEELTELSKHYEKRVEHLKRVGF